MHFVKTILPLIAILFLASCDDGRIDETHTYVADGRTVRLTATVRGTDTWPRGYDLALAGFADASDYASVVRLLRPDDDGTLDVTLGGIPADVTTVELCVLNTLHQRVATYARLTSADLTRSGTIPFDAGTADVAMFRALQTQLFDLRCTSCHGGSDHAARGLYLTDGRSYDALVGVPSRRLPDQLLVQPGNSRSSLLYQVLTTDLTATWGQPHTDMLSPDKDSHLLNLLHDWIQNGATR